MRKSIKRFATEVLAVVIAFTTISVDVVAEEQVTAVETAESVSGNELTEITEEVTLPVYQAAGENFGIFGKNGGLSWSYDESTATLTVSGEDEELNFLRNKLDTTVKQSVKKIIFQDCKAKGSLNALLQNLINIENVEFQNFDASQVSNMSDMFSNCSSLKSVIGLKTANATNMDHMFSGCSSLESLDVSGFNTSNVTDMGGMFYGCSSLKSLDVSGFNTSNVTDMSNMFSGCRNLESLDVSGFNTSNVTDMNNMFSGCRNLVNVDVSGFNSSKVINMDKMFYDCSSLVNVDLSNFDTSNLIGTEEFILFGNADKLRIIKTPKKMVEGQSISLGSYAFYDSEKKEVTSITPNYCNQMLAMPYTITYHLDGADNSVNNPANYMYDAATILLEAPQGKTGYTFDGWYADQSYETEVTQIEEGSGKDIVLYSKWLANEYTIAFRGNGATTGAMNSLSNRKYDTSYKLTANAYKRTGYKFTGWNTKADGSGKKYADKATVKNLTPTNGETITLYARWEKETYKITYKLKGGKNHKGNPTKYTVTTAKITLKKPTRTGYTFGGWYSDSKYKTKKVTQIAKGSTENKTLYAKWTANQYTIKFDGNGATGGKMKNLKNRKYDTSYKLTANAYKKTGYKFDSWNTKKNGKGKKYANKAKVKNLIAMNGKTVTLYAQWKEQ